MMSLPSHGTKWFHNSQREKAGKADGVREPTDYLQYVNTLERD